MNQITFTEPQLNGEFIFLTSRSSGPGGQNVNKVNSKVEIKFDVVNSALLTEEQKETILKKLASKISSEGVLAVVSQKDRSQVVNKQTAIDRIYQLINKALQPEIPRKPTKPTFHAIEKRLNSKRIRSEIKQARNKIDD